MMSFKINFHLAFEKNHKKKSDICTTQNIQNARYEKYNLKKHIK